MSRTRHYDIAVIGSGYAGSLIAMIARRSGRSVALLERGTHPRMAVGESSTPLSNLLLEEIALKYDLPRLRPLTKWGSWQQTYPQLACGLKRGFSFYHHGTQARKERLLVEASPHDEIADTHWYRADFDQFLVGEAERLGATYIDQFEIVSLQRNERIWKLAGQRCEKDIELTASFIFDATGPRGFLHQKLGLEEALFPDFPKTASLYSHFHGVRRFEEIHCDPGPFPADDAALHHVFEIEGERGWIWVLRFNNGLTSAGVAATGKIADRFRFSEGEPAWQRLLDALPRVREQFEGATPLVPFTFARSLSFLSASLNGSGWAMLPSCAGFVDPLLSTGFPLTLLGILRLGAILSERWGAPAFEEQINEYARLTRDELLATARLVAALYNNMGDFSLFRSISLLYFAAASYAETARRLDKPELGQSFLLSADPVFGPASRKLLERAQCKRGLLNKVEFEADLYELIDKFDVAGLGKRPADHCYPVDAADLISSAHKLGASADEMHRLLEKSGFYRPAPLAVSS